MMKAKFNWWFPAALALMLLFLILPSFFAFPAADDFCYAIMQRRYGFFVDEEYMMTNGRWASALVLHAAGFLVNHHVWYRLFPLLGIVLFCFSLYFFVMSSGLHLQIKKTKIFSITLALVTLTFLPEQSQILYWFTGAANYLTATIFSLWSYSILLRFSCSGNKFNLIAGALLLFAASSFNEVSLLSQPFILWVIFRSRKKHKQIFTISILMLFLVFLIFLLSPGNRARQSAFSIDYTDLYFWQDMILQSGRFFLYAAIPAACILLFLRKSLPVKNELYSLILLLIPMLISVVLPFMTTGMLGQQRTPSFSWLLFFPVFVIVLIQKSDLSHLCFSPKKHLILLVVLLHANILNTANDYISGKFQRFADKMENCLKEKNKNPDCNCNWNSEIPYSLYNIYPLDNSAVYKNACLEVYIEESKL